MAFTPLEGIRVVDFSWNVAGPTSTKVLAALGADVAKVEWPLRRDPGRAFSFSPVTPGAFDSSGFFADLNMGKRSFTVDPKSSEGLRLLERMISVSDLVVESYSARVLPSWGLGWERLQELNPGVVYLSVSGFGHTGPHASYVSYGPTAQAASGITAASGEPGQAPAGWGYSFLDVMTGYQAAFSVVAALQRRRSTGVGARIDLSQLETGAALLGPLLEHPPVIGESFPPGNRSTVRGAPGYRYEKGAPYGVYPTRRTDAGDHDAFIAITVQNDVQWRAFAQLIDDPVLNEQRWAHLELRIREQDELDTIVSSWTAREEKFALADLLQMHGIPAAAMENGRDRLVADPALSARQVFQEVDHPFVGRHRMSSIPVVVNGAPLPVRRVWPTLGTHTDELLGEWLGLDAKEIEQLRDEGVTWPAAEATVQPTGGAA